jgi:hypothetical protein
MLGYSSGEPRMDISARNPSYAVKGEVQSQKSALAVGGCSAVSRDLLYSRSGRVRQRSPKVRCCTVQ